MEISVNYGGWNLCVDLMGGRIKELKNGGEVILGTYQRGDGKTANTHLCLPNFANEGAEIYQLPSHGPVRNGLWKVVEQKRNSLKIEFEFEKVGIYPGRISVCQNFVLKNNLFLHRIVVKNNGSSVPLNLGIHNYLEASSGWKGLEINGKNMDEKVEASGYVVLMNNNTIGIPGLRRLRWGVNGFKYAKLWVGNGDNRYICIEPVKDKEGFIETPESVVRGGETLSFYQKISIGGAGF